MKSGSRRICSAFLLFMFVVSSWITIGCSTFKQNSKEGDMSLAVVFEGTAAKKIEPHVRAALERPVYTPQMELSFYVSFVGEDSLSAVSRWQNVLLVGTLDGVDPTSKRVQRMLNDNAREAVRNNGAALFSQKDVWVRKQTVAIVAARDNDALLEWWEESGLEAWRTLKDARDERMKRNLYALHEQKTLSDSLRQAHGWFLRVPHDYGLVTTHHGPEYLRFRRLYPDRFVTIAWRPGTIDELNAETFKAWHDSLGVHYADPIRLNPAIFSEQQAQINGHETIAFNGVWETLGPLGGGPYVAYMFHQEGTLYMLYGQVFAPDRSKELYLRQLDVIFHTFDPTGTKHD